MAYSVTNYGGALGAQYQQDPRLQLALEAMQTGTSSAPVHNPLEGLARALQAVVGAKMQQNLRGEYDTKQQSQSDAILNALAPPTVTPGVSMAGSPVDIQSPDGLAPMQGQMQGGTPALTTDNPNRAKLETVMSALGPDAGVNYALQEDTQQQARADKMMTSLTPDELTAAGLPKGTVAQRDAFGGINVVSKPDYMSQDAFNQKVQLAKIDQAPQWANISLGKQKLAEQRREFDTTSTPSGDNAAGVEYWAQQVAAGGAMPTLGMGKQAAAMRQQILNRAASINGAKGLTGADQLAITAGAKSGTSALSKITPLRAATEAYENTMMQNIGLAKQMINKGAGTTGVPVLNRWQQYARGQYAGDPDVAKFQTAIQTVKNEYAKIQSGSIGNAPVSDSARHEAESMLDPSQTPQQLMANFNYMVKETGNRTRALRATEQAIKSGLSGKNDVPQIPGIVDPQAAKPLTNTDELLKKYGVH